MHRYRRLLFLATCALLLSICHPSAATESKGGRGVRVPKIILRGRQSSRRKPKSMGGEEEQGGEETVASDSKSQDGETAVVDTDNTGGDRPKNLEEPSKQRLDEDDGPSNMQLDEDDGKKAEVEPSNMQPSNQTRSADDGKEQQPSNQTTSGIIYLAQPAHARPMPYPMMPTQQPPQRNKSSNLLSSILSLFLPRPQNLPPSPFGPPPPMPPTSPFAPAPGQSALLSLLLRLAVLSMGTLLLDLFGLGAHSEAFLPTPAQHYTFERINDRYRRDGSALRLALESAPPGIPKRRWKHIFRKRNRDAVSTLMMTEESIADASRTDISPSLANGSLYNRTVIIVDMKPDSRVGNGMAEQLRDTVSFIIEQHRDHVDKRQHHDSKLVSSRLLSSKIVPNYFSTRSYAHSNHRTPKGIRPALGTELEVVLFLDSPGGTVQDYGLASSHLSRLRKEPHITLSVCVDRVAASGGYMMACQATPGHLFAAPFAFLGSIGVLMETVNVNEVLKRYGIKPLVIKAGKNKAPLKTLGEVSEEELTMAQNDADVIHEAFQQMVFESRPNVEQSTDWIEKVCTGAVFLGKEAHQLGLVDRVVTSDEYIAEKVAAGDRVLRLLPYKGPQFNLKISPLDMLLSGMDAEGRAKIRERVLRCVASWCRLGAAVGILNHLAQCQGLSAYRWAA